MAEEPIVCDTKPILLEVEPGKHFWCACGRSSSQPFCDGSHKGTGIQPVMTELKETKKLAFCMCKHTGNPPLCDGSHAKVAAE